ncbi:MAG: hypothetical protein GXO09_06295 [Crenarchaeota archaeon]|nr:hypothetical protein [Thermoproteota archaeon]
MGRSGADGAPAERPHTTLLPIALSIAAGALLGLYGAPYCPHTVRADWRLILLVNMVFLAGLSIAARHSKQAAEAIYCLVLVLASATATKAAACRLPAPLLTAVLEASAYTAPIIETRGRARTAAKYAAAIAALVAAALVESRTLTLP